MTNKIKYLLFILLFVFIPNVHAEMGSEYITTLKPYSRLIFYDHNWGVLEAGTITFYNSVSYDSSSTPATSGATYSINGFYNTEGAYLNSKGSGYSARVSYLAADVLYSYNSYVCSNANLYSTNLKLSLNESGNDHGYLLSTTSYVKTTVSQIGNYPSSNRGGYDYCYIISSMFVPNSRLVDPSYVNLEFSRTSNTTSGVTYYVIGYDFETIGYYRDEYKEIIEEVMDKNLSNVATKKDIADVQNKVNEVKQEIKEVNDTISNNDTSESTDEANSFFSGFTTETFGLTSIITAPLNLIGNITGSKCSPLPLEAPFVNTTINLPCMSTIYNAHFGSFLTIYQTITFGIVAYWVCVRLFNLVKDFKNPDHDEIEVMDL